MLRKVFGALARGGTIAVQDFLVEDDRTDPPVGLIFAVNMLVATENGDNWSFNEIAGWPGDAGFEDVRTPEHARTVVLVVATRPK